MRTAVDSSVLLDVLSGSPSFGPISRETLRQASAEGSLVACNVVWAETRAYFASSTEFQRAMMALGVTFDPCVDKCAALAGETWRRYRRAGGPRSAIISDFLVAGHALVRADRLLTRDRGFVRAYFPKLKVLDPSRPGQT